MSIIDAFIDLVKERGHLVAIRDAPFPGIVAIRIYDKNNSFHICNIIFNQNSPIVSIFQNAYSEGIEYDLNDPTSLDEIFKAIDSWEILLR